jgi:hypothetical protein
MEEYVGLDVSMEETSVCVMDAAGEIIWEGKVATEPGELVRALHRRAPAAARVGLETGPLSTWLWHALREAQVPVVCLDARHAQAALSMRINKTDKNDAAGLAQLVRMGWYRQAAGDACRWGVAGEPGVVGAAALRARESDPRAVEELRAADKGDEGSCVRAERGGVGRQATSAARDGAGIAGGIYLGSE